MKIIEFSPEYIGALRSIYLESRKVSYTWLDTNKFKLSNFDKDTEGERIQTALEDDKVLGLIALWEPDNFIHHLYVSTKAHGTGIDTKLLEALVIDDEKPLTLKCMAQNQRALSFYESKGFAKESMDSDEFGDFYLMSSSVKPTCFRRDQQSGRNRFSARSLTCLDLPCCEGSGHALQDPPGRGNSYFRDEALVDIIDFIEAVVREQTKKNRV